MCADVPSSSLYETDLCAPGGGGCGGRDVLRRAGRGDAEVGDRGVVDDDLKNHYGGIAARFRRICAALAEPGGLPAKRSPVTTRATLSTASRPDHPPVSATAAHWPASHAQFDTHHHPMMEGDGLSRTISKMVEEKLNTEDLICEIEKLPALWDPSSAPPTRPTLALPDTSWKPPEAFHLSGHAGGQGHTFLTSLTRLQSEGWRRGRSQRRKLLYLCPLYTTMHFPLRRQDTII
ncbi:hypothetical protein O3P69_002122 [Scylla paramamosain]|uniref:Uncharacterized protein n=1 Tax=Scylla paramamosain TaxID=85552 RepID=A0AAW0V880_SCYPA